MLRYCALLTILILAVSDPGHAHQPVMDMAPRWDRGYGFQLRFEHYGSDKLLEGSVQIVNPLGVRRDVDKVWLEGVYTFDRSVRITAKLPFIRQERIKNVGGRTVAQSNRGLGDLIIGVPLKKYFNDGDSTSNISLTPSLRLPTGSTAGEYPLSDGSLDVGLSLSYSRSTPTFYMLMDAFYWINSQGKRDMREGNELGLDINLGFHPYHDNLSNSGVFVMWDISARHQQDPSQRNLTDASGDDRIYAGPIIVLYRNNMMLRAEYKMPVYENKHRIGLSRGQEFNIGLGFTF